MIEKDAEQTPGFYLSHKAIVRPRPYGTIADESDYLKLIAPTEFRNPPLTQSVTVS